LGDITLSDSPTGDSFDLVARNYYLIKELLQADQCPVRDSTQGEIKKKQLQKSSLQHHAQQTAHSVESSALN